MKANFFTIALLSVAAISFTANAVSDKDKAKMMSLMKDASPYVAGMGKSAHEVCQDMANDMVKKYGNKLSELGKTPSDIRESAYGICFDGVSSAESAKSMDEVTMWKNAAMQNVNNTFYGDNVKSPARSFLVETIEHSEKLAKTIAFAMEISQ